MDKTRFAEALATVWKLVSRANKYIDETEPCEDWDDDVSSASWEMQP